MVESVSDQTRERITEAAVAAIRDGPVSLLSVHDIAHAAGVANSTIYKAYSNKYELFAEASYRIVAGQFAEVAEGVDHTSSELDRLHQVFAGLARVGQRAPFAAAYLYGLFPLVYHQDVGASVGARIDHMDAAVRSAVRDRVADALEAGELDGDIDVLVEMCVVAAFGCLGTAATGPSTLDPEDFARFVVDGLRGM